MPSIKDIKKIKLNDEYIFFGPESIVSEIADSMDIKNIGAVPIPVSYTHLTLPTKA